MRLKDTSASSRVLKKGKKSENRSNSEAMGPTILARNGVFQHPARWKLRAQCTSSEVFNPSPVGHDSQAHASRTGRLVTSSQASMKQDNKTPVL